MRKRQKSVAFLLAALMVSGMVPTVSAMQTYSVGTNKILKGDDRYKTAVEVSKSAYANGSTKEAVIISGGAISDALSATPFAYSKNAPILLTEKNTLTLATKTELKRLGVNKVYIVGGTSSVSEAVVSQLKAESIDVERIDGNDRYETSLKVAKKMDASSDVSQIAVVNGNNGLADAISVGAPAAKNKMPILLTDGKSIPSDMQTWINSESISKSYVVGGVNTVTDTVLNKLPNKERLSGDSRNDTNAKVIEKFYTSEDLKTVYVANDSMKFSNGDKLIDALAVGPVAAKNNAPVVITGDSLSTKQRELFFNKKFNTLIQVGGNVSANSVKELQDSQKTTLEVKTITELKNAISRSNGNEVINFKPSATVSESFTVSSSKDITVNLYGTYTGTVTVDMANGDMGNYGTVNRVVLNDIDSSSFINNGTITAMEVRDTNGSKITNSSSATLKKVQIYQGAKTILNGKIDEVIVEGKDATVELNGTVTKVEVKAAAINLKLENKGTVADMNIVANNVSINNTGTITKLERQADTYVYGGGTIGNETKPDSSSGVSSIRAINAKQLEIKFSKAIDKDSIISGTDNLVADNIILTAGTGANVVATTSAKATLDTNRTTLTITLADNYAMKGNYLIYISGLSSSSVVLEAYNGTFNANDLSAPTVTASYNGVTDKFEFTLSEPIDGDVLASNIDLRIGGKIIPTGAMKVGNTTINTAGTVVTKFEVARSATDIALGATATIKISGIKDNVNNTMLEYSTPVTVTKSNLTAATPVQIDNDTIRITFSKELKANSIPTTFDHDNNGETAEVPTITIVNTSKTPNENVSIASITQVATDKRSYDITLSGTIYPSNDADQVLNITINPNYEFEDVTGTKTKLSYSNQSITMRKDKTAPTVSSVRLSTDRTGIEVVLSEEVVKPNIDSSSIAQGKVTIFRNNVNLGSTTATLGADNKTVTVKTTNPNALVGGKLKSGTYYVRFEADAFTDLNGVKSNVMETNPITIAGEAIDISLDTQSAEQKAANTFKIKLPEGSTEVFAESSLSYKNFTINGKTIDSTADITFADNNKSIVVVLKDKISTTKDYKLVVNNLSLVSRNTVNTLTTDVRLTDNCAPVLLSGELIKDSVTTEGHVKTDKIILTFDENITFDGQKGTFVSGEVSMQTLIDDISISAGSSTTSLTEVYNYGVKDADDTSYDTAVYQVDENRLILYIKHSSGDGEKSNWKDIIAKNKIRVTVKSGKVGDVQTTPIVTTSDIFVDLSITNGTVTVPNATSN